MARKAVASVVQRLSRDEDPIEMRRRTPMDIRDKVAIVTGAASGIGRELSIELAAHGCILSLVDIKEDELAQTLEAVRKHTPASSSEVCDVSDYIQVNQAVQGVLEQYGRIDILVNNAGLMIVKPFTRLSEGEFARHINVNLYGPVELIREVTPVMIRQGRGVILNIASVGGKLVVPGTTAYAASKAALYAFSEALYYELRDKGIHVGVVVPGGIRTNIFDSADNPLAHYYRDQCTTLPSQVTKAIRKAIEKERFETVVPFTANFLLAAHGIAPGLLKKALQGRMRAYME